jgi:hypothetical protein
MRTFQILKPVIHVVITALRRVRSNKIIKLTKVVALSALDMGLESGVG